MSPKYADIIIDISHEAVDRTFQYKVPEKLREQVKVGAEVSIPFGKGNQLRNGYIISLSDIPVFDVYRMKEIDSVKQGRVPIESTLIELATFIKEHYGSTMINALKTVMPIKDKVKGLTNKWVRLQINQEQIVNQLALYQKKNAKAKERLLLQLQKQPVISYAEVTKNLKISPSTLKAMISEKVIQLEEEGYYRDVFSDTNNTLNTTVRIEPNTEQQRVIEQVITEYQQGKQEVYLLKGITGSGKTLVYIEIIERMISMGKQAIVLIPEIALTYQTVRRFRECFGNQVTIMHSKLSKGERYDQFEKVKNGEVSVIIGPRSALFAPFSNLGIIVIDEEHESTYKSEYPPKYHAREVAIQRAKMSGACVLLGSATPSVESYYKASTGEYKLLVLEHRANKDAALADVSVVDLREELKNGNRSIFSQHLVDRIKDRLAKKQQIMLFINRRGFAGFVSCRSCGYVFRCPHCDVSLTLHGKGTQKEKLVCHYCGYEQIKPKFCPSCQSKYIAGFGIGTQKVEEQIRLQFPEARVLRMDMDTTRNKNSYEEILGQFEQGMADILVGTQMIVKGHDFSNVTLVGIIAADLTLFDNDYKSAERTFALLTQAAGRAGRGSLAGEVVIQTYDPKHYCIEAAANQDYEAFYQEEKAYRSLLQYPPFCHVLAIFMEHERYDVLVNLTDMLKRQLQFWCEQYTISLIGPCDATIVKVNDRYRRVVYLKHVQYNTLVEIKNQVENYIEQNNLFKECFIVFDFDPIHGY